jgi:hypothetical protein
VLAELHKEGFFAALRRNTGSGRLQFLQRRSDGDADDRQNRFLCIAVLCGAVRAPQLNPSRSYRAADQPDHPAAAPVAVMTSITARSPATWAVSFRQPTFVAKNQPAAGGLAAASAIYTTAELTAELSRVRQQRHHGPA